MEYESILNLFRDLRLGWRKEITFTKGYEEFEEICERLKDILEISEDKEYKIVRLKKNDRRN